MKVLQERLETHKGMVGGAGFAIKVLTVFYM